MLAIPESLADLTDLRPQLVEFSGQRVNLFLGDAKVGVYAAGSIESKKAHLCGS